MLMHEVDENNDGQIDYKEFESVAFELCVGITARMIANEDVPVNVDEARQFFEALFSSADVDGAGRLQRGQLGRPVEADLGHTRCTMRCSPEVIDDEGRADWADLPGSAPSCSPASSTLRSRRQWHAGESTEIRMPICSSLALIEHRLQNSWPRHQCC